MVFEELGAGHVALDCAGGPIELESIHDGGEVCLDSACEAHERTEPTGLRILQPIGEIVRALTHDQTSKALEQLVKDWTESAYLTLEGVGVPLCFWRRLYSRTRPRAWDKIKDQWGKYRLFVAAFKSYKTSEEFWDMMHTLLTREGEKLNFTSISHALRKERVTRDSADTEAAKQEYLGLKFDKEFNYRKGGKQLVLKRPHDIARRYRALKKLSVYWDEQDSDEE